MSPRNRIALSLTLVLVTALTVGALAQSGARAVPIVPPTVAKVADLPSELAGFWEGEYIYTDSGGYFRQTSLSILFTSYGNFEVRRGPITGGSTAASATFRGEYRVLGSGVLLSAQGPWIRLHDVVVDGQNLSFTSDASSDLVLKGGGSLRRQ